MNWQHLRTTSDSIRTSLWFVPSLMIAFALLIAPLARLTDRIAQESELRWVVFYRASPEAARDLLATLLTAMMTMASLIFSITMVVLTLAASQFGPRLIRNFMSSLQTQLVLGTFVMTIVYCLIVLVLMGGDTAADPLVWPSVTIPAGFVLVSIVLLPVFQHGLARSIMSETVIRRVGGELNAALRLLQPLDAPPDLHPERHLPEGFHRDAASFGPVRSGYIRAISHEKIAAVAAQAGCVVGLHFRAGDHVTADSGGIALHPPEACSAKLVEDIRQAIVIGADRTPVQDVAFSIRHLVEVAVRALSPSLNDPYTAIAAVDQLSDSLALLMRRALPPGAYRDEHQVVRVVCPIATHASLIAGGLDQIRQNGAGNTSVAIHLLDAIGRIAPHARLAQQVEALAAQAAQIRADAERLIHNPADLDAVSARERAVRAVLTDHRRSLSDGAEEDMRINDR